MPRIPTSTACQTCKSRRAKCDEKWPTCSPCKRKGCKCPGPTSLMKFVHHEYSPNKSDDQKSHENPRLGNKLPDRRHTTAGAALSVAHQNSGHSYIKFRVVSVPGKLGLPAEAVGSRLANWLEANWLLSQSCVASYMQFMPARLNHNTCLRDVVDLFCAAFTDYRRDGTVDNPTTMKMYGKALRTLRVTLEGNQARELETLASIVLLNHTECLFNSKWKPSQHIHTEVIMSLTKELGVPKPDDQFHCSVLFQSVEDLGYHSFTKRDEPFAARSPWKEWIEESGSTLFPPHLKAYAPSLLKFFTWFFDKTPKLLGKVRLIHQNPQLPEMRRLATDLVSILSNEYGVANGVLENAMSKAILIGELEIVNDPSYFVGQFYKMKINPLSTWFNLGLSFLVGMSRICYDLSILYGLPNADDYYANYRKDCVRMWMYIPQLLITHQAITSKSLSLIVLTYEGGNEAERDHVEDVVLEYDKTFRSVLKTKEQRRSWIIRRAKAMTGRLPWC